jgi:hypothetical protein
VKAVLEVTMDCRDAGRLADFWTEAVGAMGDPEGNEVDLCGRADSPRLGSACN